MLQDLYITKVKPETSWSWSYDSWIYNYLFNHCLSPLTLWVWIPLRRGVLDIHVTLCDKVCQWLTVGRCFFLSGTPVSSTNKTDSHKITEILLKVALNTIKPNQNKLYYLLVEIVLEVLFSAVSLISGLKIINKI